MACDTAGHCDFTPLHGVLHRSQLGSYISMEITHTHGVVSLSDDHFLYSKNGRKRAGEVSVGEALYVMDEVSGAVVLAEVVAVREVDVEGFVSHLTASQTLVVRMSGAWTLLSEHSAVGSLAP